MSSIRVSIVIVSYNTRELTARCVASIGTAATRTSFETIVVDNASADGSADHIEQRFPDCRVIRNTENLGFAAAVNLAAGVARGQYLLLANPDVTLGEGLVDRLVQFADLRPEFGIYGGRIRQADGSFAPGSCQGLPSLWSLFCFAVGLSALACDTRLLDPGSPADWQQDTVRVVGMVTARLLLLSRSLFGALNGFDEKYFMYGEDTDLCFRARRQGYRPVIVPSAVAECPPTAVAAHGSARKVLVLRGRVSYIHDHLRFPWLGVVMLEVGVRLRAMGTALRLRAPARAGWRTVWQLRGEWRGGYRATDAQVLAVAAD